MRTKDALGIDYEWKGFGTTTPEKPAEAAAKPPYE